MLYAREFCVYYLRSGDTDCSGTLSALRRASIAREARSMAPKAPRPRSGLGTRLFNFVTGARDRFDQ